MASCKLGRVRLAVAVWWLASVVHPSVRACIRSRKLADANVRREVHQLKPPPPLVEACIFESPMNRVSLIVYRV